MHKALLVGIDYYDSHTNLGGCVNDVNRFRQTLGMVVSDSDFTILLNEQARRKPILDALKAMVAGARPGDHCFFHFSGHGARLPLEDEPDVNEEVLCPYEFNYDFPTTSIRGSDLVDAMQGLSSTGATLTMTIDACFSGGVMEIAGEELMGRTIPPPPHILEQLLRRKGLRQLSVEAAKAVPDSVVVSACRPEETALEDEFAGVLTGVFTYNFTNHVLDEPEARLTSNIVEIGTDLAHYDMTPTLEGSMILRGSPYVDP